MRNTKHPKWWIDPLSPYGVWVFVVLTLLWIFACLLPGRGSELVRSCAWLWGYLALACLIVPYVHIARRAWITRPGRMSNCLRLHITSSYGAFLFLLLHSQGRAGSWLTLILLVLTWLVMLSGVVGFYGQKLLYAQLPQLSGTAHEYGRERYGPQRRWLLAKGLEYKASKHLTDAPTHVQDLVAKWVDSYLSRGFKFRRRWDEATDRNHCDHALLYLTGESRSTVENVWNLVLDRIRLDREYRWHLIGRGWLWIHGPAAWALLVLVIDHVQLSLRYAGWCY